MGAGLRSEVLRNVRVRDLRRARSEPARAASRARSHRHQAAVFRANGRRRMDLRFRDKGAAGASRVQRRDERRRVLALSDIHRLAGAHDVVRWRLQSAGGLLGDGRSRRSRRSAPVLGQHSAAGRVLLDQGSVVRRGGERARAVAARGDPAAHGLGRALWRAAVRWRRIRASTSR